MSRDHTHDHWVALVCTGRGSHRPVRFGDYTPDLYPSRGGPGVAPGARGASAATSGRVPDWAYNELLPDGAGVLRQRWRFDCPACRVDRPFREERLAVILDQLIGAGVRELDLSHLP